MTDKYLSQALVHLYKVATMEVKKFNSKEWISKHAYEEDGILWAKNRLHDGLSFMTAERMLREAKIEMRDLQDKLVTELGISYVTCPVQGHNWHGQVERTIRSIRESLAVLSITGCKFT